MTNQSTTFANSFHKVFIYFVSFFLNKKLLIKIRNSFKPNTGFSEIKKLFLYEIRPNRHTVFACTICLNFSCIQDTGRCPYLWQLCIPTTERINSNNLCITVPGQIQSHSGSKHARNTV